MWSRPYLLFPVLVFAAAFFLDKLFFVGGFSIYFLKTASFLNYDHKDELINELEAYLEQADRRKVVVLFGNSRTMSFDLRYIESAYPGWTLFNFSVPGGTSDYFLRYMEEFESRSLRPDFFYFAVTPQAFNAAPVVNMDEVMLNGLTPAFVARHMNRYKANDLSNYMAKQMFWTYQYRPKFRVIMRRLRTPAEVQAYETFLAFTKTALS